MPDDSKIPQALLAAGVVGLILSGVQLLSVPAWCWLALVAAGLAHSIAWRRAGIRKVSGKERRKAGVRIRNAERREKRHLRTTLRLERKMKLVLAEVRERPTMAWGTAVAGAIEKVQEELKEHERVLQHHKLVADKTAHELGEVFARVSDEE